MTAPEQSATEHAATVRDFHERQSLSWSDYDRRRLAALDALTALAERADSISAARHRWQVRAEVAEARAEEAEKELADARVIVDDLVEMKHNETGALEARVEQLEAALAPFAAKCCVHMDGSLRSYPTPRNSDECPHCIARAALAGTPGPET